MVLAIKLKELLKKKDATVAQLARASQISSKTIYQWLNGQKPRDLNLVKKVDDYFEMTINYLPFGIKSKNEYDLEELIEEIIAGQFEVILRRIRK